MQKVQTVSKFVNKQGVKSLFTVGQSKIREGFGFMQGYLMGKKNS